MRITCVDGLTCTPGEKWTDPRVQCLSGPPEIVTLQATDGSAGATHACVGDGCIVGEPWWWLFDGEVRVACVNSAGDTPIFVDVPEPPMLPGFVLGFVILVAIAALWRNR